VWSVKKERDATTDEQVLAFRWHKTLAKAQSVVVDDPNAPAAPVADSTKSEDDIPF
jgi:hypothetical protein